MPISGLKKRGYAFLFILFLVGVIMMSVGISNKNKDMYEDDASSTPLIIIGIFMILFSIMTLMIFNLKK
jgi:hypothetical protein